MRLASDIALIQPHYEVVVVGSGYGGSVAASRMARAMRAVCVLERGREWRAPEFPKTTAQVTRETQLDAPGRRIGKPTALYDFRVNPDVAALVGCGLGGGSLINSGVALRPTDEALADAAWPDELRMDLAARRLPPEFARAYALAERMLDASPYPVERGPALPKLDAMAEAARALDAHLCLPPITVAWDARTNPFHVAEQPCARCGECASGCNFHAKRSLDRTYLADAWNHGASIFTQVAVTHVERERGGWVVHFAVFDDDGAEVRRAFVRADLVFLAGGALGSTEILLRSRERAGLDLSPRLGDRFSANGDAVHFVVRKRERVAGIGIGDKKPEEVTPLPGPTIAGCIDLRRGRAGMVIQEGAIPEALLSSAGLKLERAFSEITQDFVQQLDVAAVGGASEPVPSALDRTLTLLAVADDGARGHLALRDDHVRIVWPGAGKQRNWIEVREKAETIGRAFGATSVLEPLIGAFLGEHQMTVHPLGGCPIGRDGASGVVDHAGRVFDGAGRDVHEGLHVLDGSIIPLSIGVNPFLTITALAERACALVAKERGFPLDVDAPSPRRAAPAPTVGLRFHERMKGHFSTAEKDDFAAGEARGKREDSPITIDLTVLIPDLDAFLGDEEHPARIGGTVTAPALSESPLDATHGTLDVFAPETPGRAGRRIHYRARLTAEDGRAFFLDGEKHIHDDPGFDLLADNTTLFVTLREGEAADGPVVGRGVAHIGALAVLDLVRSLEVRNAPDGQTSRAALLRFARFYAGTIWDTYF